MFDRKVFKAAALHSLSGKWKPSLLVSVLGLAIQGIATLPFTRIYVGDASYHHSFHLDLTSLLFLLPLAITGVSTIGQTFFFTRLARDTHTTTFSPFIDGLNLWLRGILAQLWLCLWTALWSLLFFIPGIVKFYAYSQLFFILSEHPNLTVRKAMQLSKHITRGYKGELFILDLSFLGWILLCYLTGGLGFIVLIPYLTETKVQAYRFLKSQAVTIGILKKEDFAPDSTHNF